MDKENQESQELIDNADKYFDPANPFGNSEHTHNNHDEYVLVKDDHYGSKK